MVKCYNIQNLTKVMCEEPQSQKKKSNIALIMESREYSIMQGKMSDGGLRSQEGEILAEVTVKLRNSVKMCRCGIYV